MPHLLHQPTACCPLSLDAPWICWEHDRAGLANEPPCCEHAAEAASMREWYVVRTTGITAERKGNMAVLAAHAATLGRAWAWLRSSRAPRQTDRVRRPG